MQMSTHHNAPWLSVIIPIYNAAKYLKKTLESIMAQPIPDFEVIMVDDGSTDNSSAIANRFAENDERIRVFRIDNSGPLYARCYGARLARGKYFTFCDADDYYAKNAFYELKKLCTSKVYDCIQFGYYKKFNHFIIKKKNARGLTSKHDEFKYRDYPILLCSFYSPSKLNHTVWNKIYHRRLLNNLPTLKERVFWGDDLILNLHLLKDCRFVLYVDEPLYIYREMSGGTTRFNINTMRDLDIIKQFQLYFFSQWDGKDREKVLEILYSEIAGWFYSYIKDCLSNISIDETCEIIEDSLKLSTFIRAREYYQDHQHNTLHVELLKAADPTLYIEHAKKDVGSETLKSKILKCIKWIVRRI